MKNKNIKLNIFGTLFNDIIVTTSQSFKKSFLDLSVFNSEIRSTYGGIFNILNYKIKNEKWNLFGDEENKIKNHKNFINFKSIPKAIILENFYNNRVSFVKKGQIKNYHNLRVERNQVFLGLYLESLPVKITSNLGTVIFDYNSSGDILNKKIFKTNYSKINFLLGSVHELAWVKNYGNMNKNITIIEHSPKEVIIKKPFSKKKLYIKLKNKFFLKNSKKTIGLGDLFALYFARNLANNLSIEENIKNIQLRIFDHIRKNN